MSPAGLVSLLPATSPACFRIRGGNSQLAARVLQVANATVHRAAVRVVQRLDDGRFSLETSPQQCGDADQTGSQRRQGQQQQQPGEQGGEQAVGEAAAGSTQAFDVVVVATPLEAAGLEFQGLDLPTVPSRKYQQTVTTIVKGDVRPSYFGLASMDYGECSWVTFGPERGQAHCASALRCLRACITAAADAAYSRAYVPGAAAVMVSEEARVPWSSLSLVGRAASTNASLWKLFSAEPMPHAWLEMMFEGGAPAVAGSDP
jgi:prenylcysteine oxidase/farnesylcysteine lyase